ncbi:Fanconi anemia group D2 protein [Euwallacea fornicatus]|uniref:Fanconi anemia group D2 protein n=1 Tax=Euwallacea fornicatus TaxID=995702 RepID=UPI00338EDC22
MSSIFSRSFSQKHSQYHFHPCTENFQKILSDVGVRLSLSSEELHVLKQEQALVVRELNKYFQNEEPDCVGQFLSGLKYLCQKEKYFKKFLIPTEFEKSVESEAKIYQNSLFGIFIRVDTLQDEILQLLLDHITTAADDEATSDTAWLRTLLKPLTCLPTIKNGEKLSRRLLDILEIANLPCQLEILEALPEVIPDNQCDFASKQLIKLLDNNEELCGAIINCLTALDFDTEVRGQINNKIIARISAGVSLRVYLILIKFLISDNCKSPNIVATLLKIRNSLDNMIGVSSKEKESDKTMIFHYLQSSALAQKHVAEGWLNTISNCKTSMDHKPIDFLIIVMLHHVFEGRKKVIEAIFRKRVSRGLFKVNLLEKGFEKHMTQQFLNDYMNDLIQIGCYLLRFAKDSIVAKFSTSLFDLLFNNKYTQAVYRGEILQNLITLTGTNDHITINTVLKLILSLEMANPDKVGTHVALLMQLLEKLDTLDLNDVKIVFEILCYLLCGSMASHDYTGFKDQICILIRKLLSRSERCIKHIGIVSAIVMVKHSVSVDGEQDILIDDSLTNELCGAPKFSSELLELVISAAGDDPDLLCLYYDQLASILASSQAFDKYFHYWLFNKIEHDFQNVFLTKSIPETTSDLKFSVQYVLNKPEETKENFAVNIVGYTVSDKNFKVLTLAPYFRVLRLLHFRQYEHLSEIDSLLGCGVLLPDVDDPNDLDVDEIKQVCDCLFHCVNWFREIVNAFVTQKHVSIKAKVIQRLDNLIEVEDKLVVFLQRVPGHNLPINHLYSDRNVKKQPLARKDPKNPKKKFKSNSIVANDTLNTSMNTQEVTAPKTKSPSSLNKKLISIQFRVMDTDIIRLIKYPLTFNGQRESAQELTLNLQQVKFILTDFISKLITLTQNKRESGLSHLNEVNPEHLIQDCVHIVRYLSNFLNIIVNKIGELLKEPEESRYTEEANDIKTCFGNILQSYCLIFQWPGFQHTTRSGLLKDILKSTREANNSQTVISVNRLIIDFTVKIAQYDEHCLHLSHAVSLVNTIEALHSLTIPTEEIKNKLSFLAESFLKRRWYDFIGKLDHGQQSNKNLDVIVRAFLKDVKVEKIAELIESLTEDVAYLEAKDGSLSMFPAIDKKNFHVFYLEMCNAQLDAVKTEIQALTDLDHLCLWLTVSGTLTNLMIIAKAVNNRTNLACFLKKTIGVLKVFLSDGIPMMEILFKSSPTEVCKVFRTIQTTTRFLHHLCCQSKLTKDTSILPHIPSFKQTIESIIYRVKAALVANDCASGFWLGNLRNKDIDRQVILSQSTEVSSSATEEGEDNQQLPSDDDDDGIIINETQSDNDSIESEVFDGSEDYAE